MRSHAKRSRNNFVRGVRAEASLDAYSRALSYVQTRGHEQAVALLVERIAYNRSELQAVNAKRAATKEVK